MRARDNAAIAWRVILLAGLALSGVSWAGFLGKGTDAGVRSFDLVPMTDGTGLATDVYLPAAGEGPWPALWSAVPTAAILTTPAT